MAKATHPARNNSLRLLAALVVMFGALAQLTPSAFAVSTTVVISQVYGGGGNTGATYTNDFIELHNLSNTTVSVAGWSVQYASAAGTTWTKTDLTGSIAPGGYYLVQEAAGSGGTTPLPTPDASGNIAMNGTAGKVALVSSTTLLTGACPTGVVDFVGFGSTANCFEGTGATPAPSNTNSVSRVNNGATDTDNNANDFTAGLAAPRSTSSAPYLPTAVPTATNTATSEATATATSEATATATSEATATATSEPTATATATTVPAACSVADVTIGSVQGSGAASPVSGSTVTVQGVVVGDYEGASPSLRGFYLQDSGDSNIATSDGIFVFESDNLNRVSVGDVVQITGVVSENQGQTQISSTADVQLCGTTGTVAPADVTLPFDSATAAEQYEGMLVRFSQTLYVTEHFQLGRFGQVLLSSGGRLKQPTNVTTPGAAALALQAQNDLNKILIDDDSQTQNPDPIKFGRGGQPLSASNTLRGGDTIDNLLGVMTYTWGGNSASPNAYRVRPIGALGGGAPNFVAANPRPSSAPAVGGSVRVVGMNLLNFFNTFDGLPDNVDNCTNGVNGAATDCRGADTQTEFDRQWPKTVAAILAMNPDVLGVNEIENDGYGSSSALQFLVDKLNAATAPGTYAFIDVDAATGQTNALGTDAIKVSMLYKPAKVTPVGQTAVLNSTAFVNGGDSSARSRPSLAQAFQENATGARFIVDVNHLKSKGSACTVPDAGDGQGNCNVVRVNAATALVSWLASDPTGTGDPDILLIGDYNSYAMEDPITTIRKGVDGQLGTSDDYTNLIMSRLGVDAYSYVFDGQWGYLDHALASSSMNSQVAGVGDYHINSDEPSVLDYNTDFKTANLQSTLYAPDQYRVSDHDPVVIGLSLDAVVPTATATSTPTNTPQPTATNTPTNTPTNTATPTATNTPTNTATPTPSNVAPVAVADTATARQNKSVVIDVLANDSDADGDTLTVVAVSPAGAGSVALTADGKVIYTAAKKGMGTDTFTYTISDGKGHTATATVTVTITK